MLALTVGVDRREMKVRRARPSWKRRLRVGEGIRFWIMALWVAVIEGRECLVFRPDLGFVTLDRIFVMGKLSNFHMILSEEIRLKVGCLTQRARRGTEREGLKGKLMKGFGGFRSACLSGGVPA